MEKLWCVYVHISPNNKYYVGITSRKPEERWRAGKGYKHNNHFTNAINKYGWDNFQHEIVASNLTEEEAKNFEKLLIAKLQSNKSEFGYNITAGGDGTVGVSHYGDTNSFYGKHHSEETKRLFSEQRKGRTGEQCYFYGKHHTEETKLLLSTVNGRPVCQFDLDFNLLSEYRSAKHAENETGVYQSMILGCCKKTAGYVTAGGFAWMFKDEIFEESIASYKARLNHDKLPKQICQFTKDMEYIATFPSIASAARACNLASPDISNALNGRNATCGDYIWIPLAEYEVMLAGEKEMRKPFVNQQWKEVCKFSLEGALIQKFQNRRAAGDSVGVTPQAIGYACRSKSHICKGYMWYFSSDLVEGVS